MEMHIRLWTVLLAAGLAMPLAGCGRPTNYAPLLPRPNELTSDSVMEPAVTAPAAPIPPAADLSAKLRQALDMARKGDADFRSAQSIQEKAIVAAYKAQPMSEPWIAAQQALSVLESARTPTVEAQTLLDSEYLNARKTGVGLAAVAQARATVVAMAAEQNSTLAALNASLSQIKTDAH